MCPLGQVLMYLSSLFIPKEKAKNKGHFVLSLSCGLILRVFLFSASAGNIYEPKIETVENCLRFKNNRKLFSPLSPSAIFAISALILGAGAVFG